MKTTIQFGIDSLLAHRLRDLQGMRVGLVTNDAATTAVLPRPMTPVRVALQAAGIQLCALFSPEHGLGASAADGDSVGDAVDKATGLPVYSLYGTTYRPTVEMLADIDVLLFDIPDIGVRFYTYIWTLSHVMEACAAANLPLWILDRPNPLSGDLACAEGPRLDEAQIASFIGRWTMPIRHSLTIGELASFWNGERQLGVDLTVVPLGNWSRTQYWPALEIPFVPASPAMPSYETALLYPGTCLFEGTNLSEGRGTATPFRHVGAPWLDAYAVAAQINQQKLPGVVVRAVQFTPTANKFADQACQGVMLHVLDEQIFRPVATGLHLVATIIQHHPQEFQWFSYPTAANGLGHGHFDLLTGQPAIKIAMSTLGEDAGPSIDQWTQTGAWAALVQPYLLYY